MKTLLTIALFAGLLVGMIGLACLALVAPYWCWPLIVGGGWKFGGTVVDCLHAVHGVPTC